MTANNGKVKLNDGEEEMIEERDMQGKNIELQTPSPELELHKTIDKLKQLEIETLSSKSSSSEVVNYFRNIWNTLSKEKKYESALDILEEESVTGKSIIVWLMTSNILSGEFLFGFSSKTELKKELRSMGIGAVPTQSIADKIFQLRGMCLLQEYILFTLYLGNEIVADLTKMKKNVQCDFQYIVNKTKIFDENLENLQDKLSDYGDIGVKIVDLVTEIKGLNLIYFIMIEQ